MVAPAPKKGDEIARGGTMAGRSGQIVTFANRWRENYNALRGLTIRRAAELIEAGQRGDTALLQWTYRRIERAHPTLSALISRCEAPLLLFNWKVSIKSELPPGADEAMAKRQQETLKDAYELVDNLKEAIQHLHLAEFRGYSHLQKHRTPDGEVLHLEPLNQWCVCRDGLQGNWYWNPDSRFTSAPLQFLGKDNAIGGEALPLEDFIIREVARPIDEIGLTNFVRQSLCEKDADGFIEIYGIPGGVVEMPANVPQGKEAEYEAAAKSIAEGGSGAIPSGSKYTPNDGPRGVDPFTPRFRHLDEQLIMVGTGGILTMLAESGSGTLAGGAQGDSFDEIAVARAAKISEIFQKDFDAEVIAREHAGEPTLVYFELVGQEEGSEESLAFVRDMVKGLVRNPTTASIVVNGIDLKETVRASGVVVNETFEQPVLPMTAESPESGAEIPTSNNQAPENNQGPSVKNRATHGGMDARPSEELTDSGIEHYARALAEDLQAMREEVAALDQISDDNVLRKRALDLATRVDAIKEDLAHLPKAARALAEVQVAALFTGLTSKNAENTKNREMPEDLIFNGDSAGHEFHGNQWTDAVAGESQRLNSRQRRNTLAKTGHMRWRGISIKKRRVTEWTRIRQLRRQRRKVNYERDAFDYC